MEPNIEKKRNKVLNTATMKLKELSNNPQKAIKQHVVTKGKTNVRKTEFCSSDILFHSVFGEAVICQTLWISALTDTFLFILSFLILF